MIGKILEKALTKTVVVPSSGRGKKTFKAQLPPPKVLLYSLTMATIFFMGLLVLEIVYIIVFHRFESNVFSGMMLIAGLVLGSIFGVRA
ncbi:hypothetical protein DRO26_03575 [Candidatus Bathyarchaeota archaeon]|nr:MAG: hypothetical protein DRO26_03575 [Candidatus Bathyarchaeota archaeon]